MSSNLKVNNILPTSGGGTVNLGASGDTITVPSGTTLNVSSATLSGITQGITEVDQWRLTADITTNTNPISANLERVDNTGFGKIGTGMSVSSGIWTFPSTGLWKIELHATGIVGDGATDVQTMVIIKTYINSGSTDVAYAYIGSNGDYDSASTSFLYNVTDTSTHQIAFRTNSMVSSTVRGDTNYNETHFNFIRLGDSV